MSLAHKQGDWRPAAEPYVDPELDEAPAEGPELIAAGKGPPRRLPARAALLLAQEAAQEGRRLAVLDLAGGEGSSSGPQPSASSLLAVGVRTLTLRLQLPQQAGNG